MAERKGGIGLVWEAIHKEPEEFGGALFDAEAKQAVLFYPGKVVRTGFLAWQKTRIDEPAEIQVVDIRTNEDLYSVELGADAEVGHLRADEVHLSLRPRGLRVTPRHVFAYHTIGRHAGRVVCMDRSAKRVAWQAGAHEAVPAHVSPSGTLVAIGTDPGGALQVLDGATGQVKRQFDGDAGDQVEAAVGDRGGVVLIDGELHGFDAEGTPTFRLEILGGEVATVADRVVVGSDDLIVAEPGSVRLLALADGVPRWRAEGPGGGQLSVADFGHIVAVHDVVGGSGHLYLRSNGEQLHHEVFERLIHLVPVGRHLVGVTDDGHALRVDPVSGSVAFDVAVEGVTLTALASVGKELVAMGLEEETDNPLLIRLDADSGTEIGRGPSPLLGEPRIEAVGPRLVSLSNPLAVFVYALTE